MILISLCSFSVSVTQCAEARLHDQPRLEYTYYYDRTGAGWRVGNSGLGPARLRGFRITVDGVAQTGLNGTWNSLGLPGVPDFSFTNPRVGDLYGAGHEKILFFGSNLGSPRMPFVKHGLGLQSRYVIVRFITNVGFRIHLRNRILREIRAMTIAALSSDKNATDGGTAKRDGPAKGSARSSAQGRVGRACQKNTRGRLRGLDHCEIDAFQSAPSNPKRGTCCLIYGPRVRFPVTHICGK